MNVHLDQLCIRTLVNETNGCCQANLPGNRPQDVPGRLDEPGILDVPGNRPQDLPGCHLVLQTLY